MKDFQPIDKVINLPHETLHEDYLGQTNAHVLQLRREGLHLREIVQLHGSGEIEEHVSQVRALVRQFVENGVGDQFNGQLDVPQRCTETSATINGELYRSRCSLAHAIA